MSAGLHAREAAEGMTRLARAGFSPAEAEQAARDLFGRLGAPAPTSEDVLLWQCHLCGQELHRDDLAAPVTKASTLALLKLLDRKYARHLRSHHRAWYLRWLLRGRPLRQWFA